MTKVDRDLIEKARALRNCMNFHEVVLWSRLMSKRLNGYKFRRQQVIYNYIVDFYCSELKLVIEVDGEIHNLKDQAEYDNKRDRLLRINGYHVLRLSNDEIEANLDSAVHKIKAFISTILSPSQGDSRGFSNPSPISDPASLSPSQGDPRGSSNPSRISDPASLSPSQGDLRGFPKISTIVKIGSLPLGGTYPVRTQSMTNSDTLDTAASVAQCIRIIEAGADYVRLTAQGIKEAENLANIKSELRKAGFDTPLIADIHFNPAAAEVAARIVEKVRINPGNYADKRASFNRIEFTDKEYAEELERIHSRLLPLINVCREHGTAIRIGVNHGSLSDRIMTRYGNTPAGMAVSAMEFISIFRAENFHQLVLSMKSSDTGVMVEATRRLVQMMTAEGFGYPLHLGVTEAGEGEDGRIRSAAGIGALLSEGIGDTIRVSLSEPPENEIPVAKEIVSFICGPTGRISTPLKMLDFKIHKTPYRPEVFTLENRRYKNEEGRMYKGKVYTLRQGEQPSFPEHPKGRLIVNGHFSEDDPEKLATDAAALLGRYFIMKQAGGICISNNGKVQGDKLKELSFSILQATDARITRNVYISCPTCGRTKFDLQAEVRKVKAATSHLTGLRIAIMGCIVNGPGEMAGSDYGYVGAAGGKVHIYRGTEAVLKNVPQESAVEKLVEMIERGER
ncbi:MAG: (E)-4-hydroxy-3-methylbut-2-enyl-diphosphate synthase [Bacteroidales bacterium]